jgi:hypothetical protein
MKAITCLILIKLEISRQFLKNTEVTNFMKIRPEGPDLLHEDGRIEGQTDLTAVIFAFRNFVNAPKNETT